MHRIRDEPGQGATAAGRHILSITELNALTRRPRDLESTEPQLTRLADIEHLWTRLLYTVHHSAVSDKHLTATCNAICYVVRTLANTTNVELRNFVCSHTRWSECFEAAKSAFAASKTKPALQVLETLAYLAKHDVVGIYAAGSIPAATSQMVRIIFTRRPKKSLKDACIILYFFLRKLSDCFSFSEVLEQVLSENKMSFIHFCRVSNISYDLLDEEPESTWVSFILSLLMITPVADSKTAVLKLLSLICTNPTQHEGEMVNIVQKAIEIYGVSNEKALGDITRDVLPSVISSKRHFYGFLPKPDANRAKTATQLNLILSQVKLGLLKLYITEDELPQILGSRLSATEIGAHNQFEIFTLLMSNTDSDVRHSACELLLSSISLKISNGDLLDSLIRSLPALHNDNDAYYRGELYSIFRRFILRVYQRLTALINSATTTTQDPSLSLFNKFLTDYTAFLVAELAPNLSYGRHILALDILCFIAKIFDYKEEFTFLPVLSGIETQKMLFRLALDPYNDVREASILVLSYLINTDRTSFEACIREIQPLETSHQLAAATNRADHADALGRLVSLLSSATHIMHDALVFSDDSAASLTDRAELLRAYTDNLLEYQVSSHFALHGAILGLSYSLADSKNRSAFQENSDLQIKLQSICETIWKLSQVHLCVDSPEVELDVEQEGNVDFGPKDVLAYAWRALRDANVLMQAMLNNLPISLELLNVVGSLCFQQLCLLRHRGAFSTVAQTFLLCCQKARSFQSGSHLTKAWFDRALLELESQADKLTRRSAGLPALFIALLDSQQETIFLVQFNVLVGIAEQEVSLQNISLAQDRMRLPQVHALNCIKDVVTNSRFRIMTEPLVMRTINLAAKCMGSPIWAIKNCGLMLLRASINRLDPDTSLGAAEAGLDVRSEAIAGNTPIDVAIFLLTGMHENGVPDHEVQDTAQTEAEFAGLDLLGRLYIQETDLDRVRSLVISKLAHPLWHVRAQAARLLVKMTQAGDLEQLIISIGGQIKGRFPVNTRHTEETSQLHKKTTDRVERTIGEEVDEYSRTKNDIHGRLLVFKEILSHGSSITFPEQALQRLTLIHVHVESLWHVLEDVTILETWLSIANTLLRMSIPAELKARLHLELRSFFNANAGHFATHTRSEEIAFYELRSRDDGANFTEPCKVLESDENIVVNVINRLKGTLTTSELFVLTSIISNRIPDAIRAAAMDTISSHMAGLPEPLSVDVLVATIETFNYNALDFIEPSARNISLSQLRLFSCFCRHALQSSNDALRDKIRRLSIGFCLHLRNAAHDEYEETSRRTAMEAISNLACSARLSEILNIFFDSDGQLEIILTLYDLLNDDDEEIRQMASVATARFCTEFRANVGALNIRDPFTSRERLRQQLLKKSGARGTLGWECFRRILGWEYDTPLVELDRHLRISVGTSTVQRELELILAASNDLFAEEKQNLYIDDCAEVQAWACIAHEIQSCLDDSLIKFFQQWASQGIQVIDAYLDALKQSKKICYDIALELLIVRTVTIARLTGVSDKELDTLKTKCLNANLPSSVVAAFDWLL